MNVYHVYQVIKNEYNSDDGHYDADPVDDTVYAAEAFAIKVRNDLNLTSIREYNYTQRRLVEAGYQTEPNNCKFDPSDIDSIERWASGRSNCLTYYTVQTLRVVFV